MRVAVLEDHVLTRAGIVATLQEGGVEVVVAVDRVPDLMRCLAVEPVDAAVLDVRLPPTFTTEGIEAAGRVRQLHPETAALVLSAHLEVDYAETLLRSAAGGLGYLLKDRVLEPATLLDSLRRVVAGECVVDPAIVAELMRSRAHFDLTEREAEVLSGIAEGLTNVGIARRLGISDRTVEVHVHRVFDKLDVPVDVESNRRVLAALTYLRR